MKSLRLCAFVIGGHSLFASTGHAALINSIGTSAGFINYNVTTGSGYLATGDFFTLYDAGASPVNLAGDIANSSLFTISISLTNTPAIFTAPTDSPTIANLRFTYIGTANLADTLLGTFSLANPAGTQGQAGRLRSNGYAWSLV